MPRPLKQNGKRIQNFKVQKAWVEIPVKSKDGSTSKNVETYLVQPRVVDYIEKLESMIKEELPQLPIKTK